VRQPRSTPAPQASPDGRSRRITSLAGDAYIPQCCQAACAATVSCAGLRDSALLPAVRCAPGASATRVPLRLRGRRRARAGNFPKSVCTSVNECICHGIPDSRPLVKGDIVNIDVTVYLNVGTLSGPLVAIHP